MTLKVNIPRVVLNRPGEYRISKDRFPKLKTLVIDYLFECFGDGGPRADGDTTQFLDVISRDVTELVIRDLTRYRGSLCIDCEDVRTELLRMPGRTLADWASDDHAYTYGQLAVEIHELTRSVTARSERHLPPLQVVPAGHSPDEMLNTIIIIQATF